MDFTLTVFYILRWPCILLFVTKRKNNIAKGENNMKKALTIILSMVMSLTLLAACGGNEPTPSSSGSSSEPESQSSSSSENQAAALSGTLTLGGSTSVENVIQSMMEAYMVENPDVTITYAPTVLALELKAPEMDLWISVYQAEL